ncbi:hypothetical protein LR48_Vigan11g094100 [Vigna angularis]|uniref:Uncharacterized protein n=1 Tax=Phaseolus angularis TaxID=3914 RepID=A0A0L9VSH9_PHAAN|nr:hypothetical protein LR48_Vigan11g094100 [Vigna angularis]
MSFTHFTPFTGPPTFTRALSVPPFQSTKVVPLFDCVFRVFYRAYFVVVIGDLKDANSCRTFHRFKAPLKAKTTIDVGFEVFCRSFLYNHSLEALNENNRITTIKENQNEPRKLTSGVFSSSMVVFAYNGASKWWLQRNERRKTSKLTSMVVDDQSELA